VTFWHLEKKNFTKKWIKMPKKLADLACTREIFLYKNGQVSNKSAIRLLVPLFTFTCYCLDTWQARSNATKRGQENLPFADVPGGVSGWMGIRVREAGLGGRDEGKNNANSVVN
jgi:hypothetical protein